MTTAPYTRTPLAVTTGILLVLAPLIAWGFKFMSLGWMIVMIVMGPILVLLVGYILQIIIAAQGFLSRKTVFGSATLRATIPAWLTSISVVLLGIFMPDGGDIGYGSTFQVWLGAYGPNGDAVHAATDSFNDVIAVVLAACWIGGFLWLFIEWVIGLSKRSKQNRAARTAALAQG